MFLSAKGLHIVTYRQKSVKNSQNQKQFLFGNHVKNTYVFGFRVVMVVRSTHYRWPQKVISPAQLYKFHLLCNLHLTYMYM